MLFFDLLNRSGKRNIHFVCVTTHPKTQPSRKKEKLNQHLYNSYAMRIMFYYCVTVFDVVIRLWLFDILEMKHPNGCCRAVVVETSLLLD